MNKTVPLGPHSRYRSHMAASSITSLNPLVRPFDDLKRLIAQETGMMPQMQRLFFRGKEKEDCDCLQMTRVKDNSKVLLLEDTKDMEMSSKEMKETIEISRGGAGVAEVRAEADKLSEKSLVEIMDDLKERNSNPFIDRSNVVSVTTIGRHCSWCWKCS